jgi:hypothetical protein
VTFLYYGPGTQSQVVEITVTKTSVDLDKAHELFTAQHMVRVPLAAMVSLMMSLKVALNPLQSVQATSRVSVELRFWICTLTHVAQQSVVFATAEYSVGNVPDVIPVTSLKHITNDWRNAGSIG